jgi:uncharacterized protein YdhG (YjbR/CyaY superfamily)
MPATQKPAKPAPKAAAKAYDGFTDDERAAMKDHAQELKAAARRGSRLDKAAQAAEEEAAVLEKIAEMTDSDRAMAERLHALIKANVPDLAPKLWYGMPAYALNGKTVCFFQSAQKFKSRYAMLGFSDAANLDEGVMWPTYYALTELTEANESRVADLVNRAVS